MKKLFFTLCALCVSVSMWADTTGTDIQKDATTGLYFATVTYDNATTNPVIAIIPAQEGESYTISNLVKNDDGTYTLPATVQAEGGEAVALQGVAASTFASVLTDTSNPIHLVIPANIVDMGQHAFQNCTQIEEVTVEYSETALDEAHNVTYGNSFSGCSNLKVVTQNRNITIHRNNENGASYYCFPFSDLPSITTVYIGEEVTSLSNNAYNSHTSGNLDTVYCYATNPPSVDHNPFSNHKDGCILYVHEYALEIYNTNETWVDIFGYDNIKAMIETDEEQPEGTLRDVTTGLYFEIDTEGVVSIVADASGVYTDSNLVKNDDGSYTLPEYVEDKSGTSGNVTRIGAQAFENSAISGHLVVPAHITQMGSQAFKGCTGLTEVTYEYSAIQLSEEGDAYEYSFDGCSNVKTVNLNRNIGLAHGNGSFCAPFTYQSYITTITIGENVTSIPHYMFRQGSTNTVLQTATSYAKTPPSLGSDPFGVTSATLYVPFGMSEAYTNAGWSTYFPTIVEMESTGLEEGTYLDIDTGLYFELNNDGTASIYYDEAGVYTDNNLVPYSYDTEGNANAYTLPEKVSADGETYYDVTRVEADAFANSSISGHLVIPATIINMGERAFASCTDITEVTYEYGPSALNEENSTNMSNGSFMSCSGVKTVNLYRDITYLAGAGNQYGPFRGVTSITEVNIGPRVTYIPAYIFRPASGTNNISTINCYAAEPPSLGSIPFSTLPSVYTINVPQGSVNAYTTSWTDYSNFAELSNAYAVDITLTNEDGYYYATYYNSNAVDIYPQGGTENVVTSYAVSGVTVEDEEEGYLDLAEVGATIPAQTAVLVEATAEGTYTIIETTAAGSASYTGTNDLYGYDEATEVTDDSSYYYYTLSHPSGGGSLGFYWATSDGSATSFTSAAHKAYLMLLKSEVVNLKSISLRKGDGGGDTTGITSVEVENEAKAVKGIYTVQGVRVSNMNQPGLYIVDGKKVLVK